MSAQNETLLSVFVAVEGAHAFSAFMPSYFTVRKFATHAEDVSKLRSGYAPAMLFNLLLGALVSHMTKSWMPLLFSVAVVVFMLALYEGAVQAVPGARSGNRNA